ncbi:D-glycero-beta-D-manno-heptose 1,7-bisphosphate 7-phosphatase [Candidatus Woesearchaeota archaeon]|nr:D-glycero-beta-D-manno-heptose 1,7-bisphosphate 7-phosphatase [Candidatus Woesearchaeota archaeon]
MDKPQQKAIFFDRDGTINVDEGYVHRSIEFQFIHSALRGLKKMMNTGYKLIIVTNQSGIGRGYYSEEDFKKLMQYMHEELLKKGIRMEKKYYFCPHHPDGKGKYAKMCDCRKPLPGMLHEAAKDYDLDLSQCIMIGDKAADIEAGKAAGCKTIFVLTGHGTKEDAENSKPDVMVENLEKAAAWIKTIPSAKDI